MKNIKQNIMKGFSLLLLAAILQSNVCSVMCATGLYSCCGKMKTDMKGCHKSCCQKKAANEKQESGCEKEHFAFFQAVGQFHSIGAVVLTKIIQPSISIPYSQLFIQQTNSSGNFIAYNCFHPPPLSGDVCILNSSLRI